MKPSSAEDRLYRQVPETVTSCCRRATANLKWLKEQMHPYFAITMQDEPEAVATLALKLKELVHDNRLVLADRDKRLIVARPNLPGSLYDTLRSLSEREISYAQFTQSYGAIPGLVHGLEIQRFEFDRKPHHEIAAGLETVVIPTSMRRGVSAALKENYPDYDLRRLGRELGLLLLNNENYVLLSPPRRIAQILWLYQQSNLQGGIHFDVEQTEDTMHRREYRVMFAAGNPPQMDFLVQTMEVFNRLEIGVKRAYCLTISNGAHPYFLGTFYVRTRDEGIAERGSALFERLRIELYNTQILSTASHAYKFVVQRVMTGEEASLVNAFMTFCHTNLAHNQPDRFGYEDVMRTFHSHPEMALQLIRLFRARFDPAVDGREKLYAATLAETEQAIADYNTGHRYLDEVRRTIFSCCLLLIRHTLKTNAFIAEKQALAFRLDPAYLEELGEEFTSDLPPGRPFRITFFFGRHGAGYHIGFSDIARGGWRTILTKGWDDYVTSANTLFRENYVLAHTQHLKNKDIYEGGSKMVTVLDAADLDDHDLVTRRLYKLQYGFLNAFLDIFVTDENGRAKDPRVVDYYGEDEPIELGPDENMHDEMVELIAQQSLKRGYLLGIGLISSKRVGINHKEYGVTSAGVVTFAETAMAELGIDIRKDPFSVKFTGGPGGDVAGNAMRLLLERCPEVRINLIIDGSGALYDPAGADRDELRRLLLQKDVDGFHPSRLGPGGFLLYRGDRRRDGLRELYKKVVRTEEGLSEQWVTNDEFYREFNDLIFTVSADLFIPGGGRPETVDADNWQRFFAKDGSATMKAVVEGANSFITPAARTELQKRGVVVLRDASANKCGVISSSYEIIANLLLSEKEFLAHKERYVADVLNILEQRAGDEARLIFKRKREPGCTATYTEISEAISHEINAHYAKLFAFFQKQPQLCDEPLFQRAIRSHLPRLLRDSRTYRQRIVNLPAKYRSAILASEIASSLVYHGDPQADFLDLLKGHLERNFDNHR